MNTSELKLKAQRSKLSKIKSGGWLYRLERKLSFLISVILTRLFPNLSPNLVSFTAVLTVFVALALSLVINLENIYYIIFLQFFLLFFSSVLDKVDGELARIQDNYSQRGLYYDILFHLFYFLLI